jgi:hypothetical protein
MKRVFSSHDEVAHIWASQSQAEGRAGNIFFEDGVIYSYGRHFPVARFATEYAPSEHGYIVLFTNRGYSSSTGKHKGIIRSAIPNFYKVVYCDDPTRSVEHNLGKWQKAVDYLRLDFAAKTHKITRGNLAVEIFKTCESALVYCMALGIEAPEWTNEYNDEMTARDYVYELAKARDAKRELKRAEAEKLARIKATERLPMWEQGETVPTEGFHLLETALRLKGDTIETSRGARIPSADAIKLWPLLLRSHKTNKAIDCGLRSIQLGSYRFNSFDGHTLVVGCHTITWPQLEKMAIKLNLQGA